MKRAKTAKKIQSNTKDFLKKNPKIKEALRLFDVSYERYKMATEQSHFYTDISTTPTMIYGARDIKARR